MNSINRRLARLQGLGFAGDAPRTERFVLYRVYDEDGALLYVDGTGNFGRHMSRHHYRQQSWPWVALMRRVEISEPYATRAALDDALKVATASERPLFSRTWRAPHADDGPAPDLKGFEDL